MRAKPALRTLASERDVHRLLAHGPAIVVAHRPGSAAGRAALREVAAFAAASRRAVGIGALDVAEHPDLAIVLGVDEVPTLLFFLDGAVVMRELVPDAPDLGGELRRARDAWWRYLTPDAPTWPPRAEA